MEIYITSKSVRGSTKAEKEWILNQDGYIKISDNFKYKTKVIKKTHRNSNGTEIEYSEKVLTYWSKRFFEKEKASFYETVNKIIESPTTFRATKAQSSILKKYLKKEYFNKQSGEVVNADNLVAQLDIEKIKQEYELLGYYTIITSEVNMEDAKIIDTYKNLVEIKDQFRVMKSTLETRPIFVRTPEHT